MKDKRLLKVIIILLGGVLTGCSSIDKNEKVDNKKKEEKISFMTSLEQTPNRVWVVLDTEKISQDSQIKYALKSAGKNKIMFHEYVDVTLKDLNSVDNEKVWTEIKDKSQNFSEESIVEEIGSVKSMIDMDTTTLQQLDPSNPNDSRDGMNKEILEKSIADNTVLLNQLEEKKSYVPLELPIKVTFDKNSNGETIEIGKNEPLIENSNNEYLSPLSKYFELELSNIIEEKVDVLGRAYIGYTGDGKAIITREDKEKQKLVFDEK